MTDNPFQAPTSSGGENPQAFASGRGETKTIRYIHPLQAGKVGGVLGALLPTVILVIYAIIMVVVGLAQGEPTLIGVAIGMLLFGPIFYGVMGFLFGALWALIYNWVAGMGIAFRVDFE